MATNAQDQVRQPLIPRERVLVAVVNDVQYDLRCASDFGLGAEVQIFGMPPHLGKDSAEELRTMARRLEEIEGPIGFHGPFIDMAHVSPDPAIREVCKMRYVDALPMAQELGAQYSVYHTQYNPLLKFPDYPDIFHMQSLEIWPSLVAEADERNITIYVENMFDAGPTPARRLAESMDHPRFQLCLDVAHAVIYSDVPIREWIEAFKPWLGLVHINDNDGIHDLHQALGKGTLDIEGAIKLIEDCGAEPLYTLETNRGGRESAQFLGYNPV
jgi:sugar phosphate isomerase/epimerase